MGDPFVGFEDKMYHYFMIPFFLIGGTIEIIAGIEPEIIFKPIGVMTIGIGIFLIWLDRNYDLNSNEVENIIEEEY